MWAGPSEEDRLTNSVSKAGWISRGKGSERCTRRWRRSLALLTLISACSTDRPAGPTLTFVPRCTPEQTAELVLSVGSGTEPLFEWTPACGVLRLQVDYHDPAYPDLPPVYAWSRTEFFLAPPVQYGVEPPSPLPVLLPAEPLEAGRTYTVRLYMYDLAASAEVEVTSKQFVP